MSCDLACHLIKTNISDQIWKVAQLIMDSNNTVILAYQEEFDCSVFGSLLK